MAIIDNFSEKIGNISANQTRVEGHYTVDRDSKTLKLETGTGNQNMVFEEKELNQLYEVVKSLVSNHERDNRFNITVGDVSDDGTVTILSEDSFCFRVLSRNHGATGIRTISKDILLEWIDYIKKNPQTTANAARDFLKEKTDNDKFEYGYASTFMCLAKMDIARIGIEKAFKALSPSVCKKSNLPLQQIYYGAPGTGKSHEVDDICKKYKHYRTTFHPDSDYSTFVGCYKPKSKNVPYSSASTLKSEMELTNLWNTSTLSYHEFVGLYYKSVMTMSTSQLKDIFINNAIGDRKTTDSVVNQETRKAIKAAQVYADSLIGESKITYEFTPQAFTNAYVDAWKNLKEDVFLVIEEINRGNCAQIFGDIFQLLDRNDAGYSTYEITPDTDLQDYISQQGLNISGVTDSDGKDISAKIASGELMKLPPNLHIWATMNTSDQSLFPIDSAFKRRWDWVYKPIKYDNKTWKVELKDGSWCLWTDLQTTLNDLIYDATESEDKMLGDWFVKAENNKISEDVLVGKIVFYLWNDVAKVDAGKLFDLEVEKNGRKPRKVIFSDFYNVDGTINTEVVKNWLKSIEITLNEGD